MTQRKAAFCWKHMKRHVRFDGYESSDYSWGCPVCVKEWSDAVRELIENNKKSILFKRKDKAS